MSNFVLYNYLSGSEIRGCDFTKYESDGSLLLGQTVCRSSHFQLPGFGTPAGDHYIKVRISNCFSLDCKRYYLFFCLGFFLFDLIRFAGGKTPYIREGDRR